MVDFLFVLVIRNLSWDGAPVIFMSWNEGSNKLLMNQGLLSGRGPANDPGALWESSLQSEDSDGQTSIVTPLLEYYDSYVCYRSKF